MVEVTQEPTEVELVLAGGVSVTVRVIDEQTGAPVNNVWVRAGPRGAENITVADGRTNAEGLCILKVSTGEYVIKAQGWMNGRLNDFSEDVRVGTDDKDLIVEIAITPRRIISGLLIDTGGKPVAGTASLGSDSTAAGMDGRFELPQPWGDEMQVHIGFALAPVADAEPHSRAAQVKTRNHSDTGSKSEQFASAFNSHMRKCLSVAEEQAEKIGEFINAKLAESRTKGGQ